MSNPSWKPRVSPQGVTYSPSTLGQLVNWYRRLFQHLGYVLLRQEEGDTLAVNHYLHSIDKLEASMTDLRDRIRDSDKKDALNYRLAKLAILKQHAHEMFGEHAGLAEQMPRVAAAIARSFADTPTAVAPTAVAHPAATPTPSTPAKTTPPVTSPKLPATCVFPKSTTIYTTFDKRKHGDVVHRFQTLVDQLYTHGDTMPYKQNKDLRHELESLLYQIYYYEEAGSKLGNYTRTLNESGEAGGLARCVLGDSDVIYVLGQARKAVETAKKNKTLTAAPPPYVPKEEEAQFI